MGLRFHNAADSCAVVAAPVAAALVAAALVAAALKTTALLAAIAQANQNLRHQTHHTFAATAPHAKIQQVDAMIQRQGQGYTMNGQGSPSQGIQRV
eukprot:SAG31_NODE_753_length_12340_cov_8.786619_6_plen_96_part_00